MTVTRAQKAALQDAAKRGYIFGYTPNSRYSHYEPGKHTHAVADRLVEKGLLHPADWGRHGAYAITDEGRKAAA